MTNVEIKLNFAKIPPSFVRIQVISADFASNETTMLAGAALKCGLTPPTCVSDRVNRTEWQTHTPAFRPTLLSKSASPASATSKERRARVCGVLVRGTHWKTKHNNALILPT